MILAQAIYSLEFRKAQLLFNYQKHAVDLQFSASYSYSGRAAHVNQHKVFGWRFLKSAASLAQLL
jgi:hypothetical protein